MLGGRERKGGEGAVEVDVGSPKKKYRQDVYSEKMGFVSKSYKLHISVVKDFAAACQRAGVSQAAQLTRMMKDFAGKK